MSTQVKIPIITVYLIAYFLRHYNSFNCFFFYISTEKTLRSFGLTDKPSQLFNCDETGFSRKDAVNTERVVGSRGRKVYQNQVKDIPFIPNAHYLLLGVYSYCLDIYYIIC